ncbi:regulatory protein MarR [Sphingobium chlorophenolicum L-1]|uniref:Regulatory protein MarR n=3 Tax=Sphingobium chlorophenolicum TaxID=46429 RepID=F6F3Q4_SPHCR|nr:MarR family transcriptional regulator [Sphingobium chlorophenolicum]AEG51066.1 regulatory protein MarR [Sphingobium chlorophenolicum L-1]KEQ52348.1 Regulatory protein MarR [Sphingobium chlorophenolicum]
MSALKPIAFLEEVRNTPHICLAEGLRSANRAIMKRYVDNMAGSPVNPVQMSLLMRVYYLRNATMQTLAQHLETDRTTTTRNVDILVRDGFLEITEGADKRQRLVRLTKRGHEALEESIPKWRKAQDELRSALGDEPWTNILRDTRLLIELGGIACDRGAPTA